MRDVTLSLKNNPIECDCRNSDFFQLIYGNRTLKAHNHLDVLEEELLECSYTNELISSLNWTQIVWTENCFCQPQKYSYGTIITCKKVPKTLPNATKVELRFSNIKSENLTYISHLINSKNIISLSLNGNALENIDDLNIPTTLRVRRGARRPLFKNFSLSSYMLHLIIIWIVFQELKLDHNNLTYLHEGSIANLSRRGLNVSLHDNPWECQCKFLDFLKNAKSTVSQSR